MPGALDSILAVCRTWDKKHLIDIKSLSREEILLILKLAKDIKQKYENELKSAQPLKGKRIVTMFAESSTRTKISFQVAAKNLGADTVDLSIQSSSVQKGESLRDTAKTIEAIGADAIVVRHPSSGVPVYLTRQVKSCIINAGDGSNEHPTQALLDLMTIEEALGRLNNLHIAIVGDIVHSRVARSNIWAHQRIGNKITLVGPPTLLPETYKNFQVDITYDLDSILDKVDVVMTLRLQLERMQQNLLTSTREYARLYGLNLERLARIKKNAIVMHPGPMNPGIEITSFTAYGDRSVILNQVTNGVYIRMALLLLLLCKQS